uniref:LRR receptor-like kinase family protein n=1 Tax=Rhizophora mucronata TaxID=61149 RepID=A0A2P2MD98_RHIMU
MGQGLNMSLFTPFKELLNLDLTLNGFNDCYQSYGFKGLKNLVTLDLSYNSFSSIIQPCLSPLTSLQSLHLEQSVNYDANLSIPDFKALKNLETLDLSTNIIYGTTSGRHHKSQVSTSLAQLASM